MADALCGPSNALQNFQKHTSVDRTLQQDRLSTLHSPTQGFRSSPGPSAGLLDPEFDAFQAGHAGPPPPDFNLHAHPRPLHPHITQPHVSPDWASDFQRLNIAPSRPPQAQRHLPPPSNAPAAWHQEFMRQQQVPTPQVSTQQQAMFGARSPVTAWTGSNFQQRPGFHGLTGAPTSEVAHGKQRASESVLQFDNAAFERAFDELQKDLLQDTLAEDVGAAQTRHTPSQETQSPAQGHQTMAQETDLVLRSIQEKRLPVYMAIKLRSAFDLGQHSEAETWLYRLEEMERKGKVTADASEARWCVEALEKIASHDELPDFKTRAENLITSTNERLMSQYPLLSSRVPINHDNIWEDLEAAGYPTSRLMPEKTEQQPEQKDDERPRHNDDEMAETAGRLLERVADNTSDKFQNSQFLELMRRLRDREVKVDGDKMVEVSTSPSSAAAPASSIPEVDLGILNHSAMDYGMPIDSEQEHDGRAI